MRVPPVNTAALPKLLQAESGLRVMLLNWAQAVKGQQLQPLVDSANVTFEISTIEGIEGVARVIERVSAERVVFGSNFPLFYFESALLKIQEAGLTDRVKSLVLDGNAKRILSTAKTSAA
jgi:predicted TIM-barrel fold metal-dependent hydrolase